MPRSLILIHGAFSNPGHFDAWRRSFERAGYRCEVPALPGHAPGGHKAVRGLTMADYFESLRGEIAELSAPPILIGHSMGGLLAQQLAAAMPCAALVCVASAPPWMLKAQARALPRLAPMMPAILAGQPFRPSAGTLRALALHDLSEADQARLAPSFVAESGKAYRSMILGTARLPGPRFRGPVLCVSGGGDRIVSAATSRAIAKHYRAEHFVYPDRGHWLIADTAVAERVRHWLDRQFPRRTQEKP